MVEDTADDEPSQLTQAADAVREAAEAEWEETTITERMTVLLPKGSDERLREAADETWEGETHSSHGAAPGESLQVNIAEQVATERFRERHTVKHTSSINAIAKHTHRTRIGRLDDERTHFDVFKVIVYL